MRRLLSFLFCAALGAAGFARADDDAPTPQPKTLDEFKAEAAKLLEKHHVAGASIALIENGEVAWSGGIGLADKGRDLKADAHTHFRIGSITKMFCAIAVMQLVEQGKLTLDDEVAKLVPEVPLDNPWAATDPVRVVHALEHTAGFDDMHFSRFLLAPGDTSLTKIMQQYAPELHSRWRPGTFHSYSNPGYGLAALVVEKVSGEEYREYVKRHVWAPLGMSETYWDVDRAKAQATLATGYADDGSPEAFDDIKLYPAGAVVSTADDMAKLARFLIARGATAPGTLGAASIERMERQASTASSRAGLAAGYGLANMRFERGNVMMQGHDGGVTGFLSSLYYSPENRFGFVDFINALDADTYRGLRDLAANYLSRDLAKPEPGALDRGASADSRWDGWYYADNPRNELLAGIERLINVGRIGAIGNRYTITHPVIPQSESYFAMPGGLTRREKQSYPSGVFLLDADGRAVMTTRDDVFARGTWWSVALPAYAMTAALALLLSSLLFAPVWLGRAAFGKLRGAPHVSTRVWPLLASLTFVATVGVATMLSIPDLTSPNAKTLAVMIGGLAFGAFALLGTVQSVRTHRSAMNRVVAWHSLLVSAAALGLAVWLWRNHLLGLRMWAW